MNTPSAAPAAPETPAAPAAPAAAAPETPAAPAAPAAAAPETPTAPAAPAAEAVGTSEVAAQETAPEPAPGLNVAPAEGHEQFQADYEAFSTEATAWAAANPEASTQATLQWAADRQAAATATAIQAQRAADEGTIDAWNAETRSDPKVGGDQLAANLAIAESAMEAFGSPELTEFLQASGLGSHPGFVKFSIAAGKAVSEATNVTGGPAGGKKDLGSALYGTKT